MSEREAFPKTRWSMIYRAAGGARGACGGVDHSAADALGELLAEYQPVLVGFLVGVTKLSRDAAEDLAQGFIADKIMADRLLQHANQTRGRFRSFLLKALEHYRVSTHRKQSAKKRRPDGGVLSPADGAPEPAITQTADNQFDLAWARHLLQRCLTQFEADCRRNGDDAAWTLFELRVLRPTLYGDRPAEYGQLIEQLPFSSPRQTANALITAKRRFTRIVRDHIAAYVRDEAELNDEIRDLFRILSQPRAGRVSDLRS